MRKARYSRTTVYKYLIHSRQVGLNGYRAELERTVIVGKPTSMEEKAFAAAIEAQARAMEFIKPGCTLLGSRFSCEGSV
ncbi:hypothetical protein GCM10010978_30820 [Compostibacillus humi]|uniref:Peptidase M24 domain-containing protein n=1 Tax=Compostibacillus humi TaxID=1245525 RepID=A0A8J2TQQ9_9BACI|nr:hypothetical protein GCM10010978_30820 [Compostibacillus humi]